MNDTDANYRMNPAEDTLLPGSRLAEGMWVLAEIPGLRKPYASSEDDRMRQQRFRQVTNLRRKPASAANGTPELAVFTGIWVDGYQETHTSGLDTEWIVKKAPAPEVTATVTKGDIIRIVPEKGPERVMVVAHVEHYVITLADLPAEGG